jgi:hypothetical protein
MEAIQILRRLHQYRAWCNRQLLNACRLLSAEQLHAPFEMGQGSVWRSLVHLLAADSLWLDAFGVAPTPPCCPLATPFQQGLRGLHRPMDGPITVPAFGCVSASTSRKEKLLVHSQTQCE